MAATIQIHEMSALAAGVNKTSGTVRFKAADNNTVDTNDPIVVPASGTTYSYTKTLRAYMLAAPDTNVSDFEWYSDGANGLGTGVGVQVRNLGTSWTANINTVMGSSTDLFASTSGSPLDGAVTDTGPWLPADNETYIGDLIRLQMSVADTATNGATPTETLTLRHKEI